MKYNPKRNYLHPVLRPYSDDYPEGSLQTQITRAVIVNGTLNLALNFEVSEPSIQVEIDNGNAICVAMLYCGSTLYREMLSAGTGSSEIKESIDSRLLRGNVEINPAIIVNNPTNHPTDTAHNEYESAPVSIGQWHPLAVDQPWHFQINPSVRSAKGIFNLETDDSLSDGEFDIKNDLSDRYISITANSSTRDKFKILPGDQSRSLATVFMSALVAALAEVREIDDDHDVHDDGWVRCIKFNLKQKGIDIGNSDEKGPDSLLKAAQALLDNPFDTFIAEAILEAVYDDDDEEEES